MKIAKVETAWITVPCNPPQGLSLGDITQSTDAVCRITTDDGIVGIGEARGAALPEICQVIDELYAPLLIGENPEYSEYLWNKLHDAYLGRQPYGMWGTRVRAAQAALAAVDLAIYDIRAKAKGLSVCELLGGKPHAVQAYLSKAFYVEGQSLEDMCSEAVQELEKDGYTHMKMRVGRHGADDAVKRIAAVRRAVGPDMRIGVDVNQAFDFKTAVEVVHRVEQFDLMWLEEPFGRIPRGSDVGVPGYDWDEQLGKLSRETSIPLSAGENHYCLKDCLSLVSKGNIRYMQFDVTKNGGVTEWMKVASLCQAYGVLMAPHHVAHFHIQLAAAVPNAFIMELYDDARQHPAWPHLFPGFPVVNGGMLQCPKGPGWGMDVDEAFLKKHGHAVSWQYRK